MHVLPIRLEAQPCNDLEIQLIDVLGRFCIPEPYQGPLVNLARDPHDPSYLSERAAEGVTEFYWVGYI